MRYKTRESANPIKKRSSSRGFFSHAFLDSEEKTKQAPSQTKPPFLIKHSFHLTFFFFYTIDSESKRNIRNVYVMKI